MYNERDFSERAVSKPLFQTSGAWDVIVSARPYIYCGWYTKLSTWQELDLWYHQQTANKNDHSGSNAGLDPGSQPLKRLVLDVWSRLDQGIWRVTLSMGEHDATFTKREDGDHLADDDRHTTATSNPVNYLGLRLNWRMYERNVNYFEHWDKQRWDPNYLKRSQS